MNRSKPTIDDVAALAGVARTTVSRVLNNHPNVREEVREKVNQAVATLGYRVNIQARQLASRPMLRIGLVHASDFDVEPNSYFAAALELGAMRAATQLGAQMITLVINQNDPDAAAEIVNRVRDDQCEGVILTPPFADDSALLRCLIGQELSVVCVAGGPEAESLAPTLSIDEFAAGREIGEHLLALGHRRFGFIKGLENHRAAEGRFDGFLAALAAAALDADQIKWQRGNFTFRSGLDCAQTLLAENPGITALVCANDDMAAGALLAAHKAGLAVPQEIAITGFDDTPVSEIVWPPLTTIHQPLRSMGARAVALLAGLTNDPALGKPRREIVDHILVVRDSSRA